MSARRLAVFDLDGTLIDSRLTIQAAMEDAFTAMGLPPPDYDRTRRIVGLGLEEATARLAPDLSPQEHRRLAHFYREAFVINRASGRGPEPLYDGAKALVEDLAADGWRLAIATGKARRGVRHFFDLHGMEALFEASVCADDGPGKPHPFMVEACLKATGAAPHEAIMIGDAVFDIQMGKAANVAAHGVAWGFGRADELAEAGADAVHHAMDDLRAALEAFAAGARLGA